MMHLFPIALALLGASTIPAEARSTKMVKIEVTEKGFVPSAINVKPGTNVTLEVTRKTDNTCSKEILVPSRNITKMLPLNKTVTIALGELKVGEIRFGCAMDLMDSGTIVVN